MGIEFKFLVNVIITTEESQRLDYRDIVSPVLIVFCAVERSNLGQENPQDVKEQDKIHLKREKVRYWSSQGKTRSIYFIP